MPMPVTADRGVSRLVGRAAGRPVYFAPPCLSPGSGSQTFSGSGPGALRLGRLVGRAAGRPVYFSGPCVGRPTPGFRYLSRLVGRAADQPVYEFGCCPGGSGSGSLASGSGSGSGHAPIFVEACPGAPPLPEPLFLTIAGAGCFPPVSGDCNCLNGQVQQLNYMGFSGGTHIWECMFFGDCLDGGAADFRLTYQPGVFTGADSFSFFLRDVGDYWNALQQYFPISCPPAFQLHAYLFDADDFFFPTRYLGCHQVCSNPVEIYVTG